MVAASKYTIVFRPIRPTLFMSPTCAMPTTTVQKMTGATIILIRLMNMSPKILQPTAMSGATTPSAMPRAMPSRTWP